jgi:hypothetical protein
LVAKASERATEGTVVAGENASRRLATAIRERSIGEKDEPVTSALIYVDDVPDSPSSRS